MLVNTVKSQLPKKRARALKIMIASPFIIPETQTPWHKPKRTQMVIKITLFAITLTITIQKIVAFGFQKNIMSRFVF